MTERSASAAAAISAGLDHYHSRSADNDAARSLAALLADVPTRVPCAEHPDWWISKSPSAREAARNLCSGCPIVSQCPSAFVTINGQDADKAWTPNGKVRKFSPFRR